MQYVIETTNLKKKFKRLCAVSDLSLRVPEGKIYGFLGKNGAGKTTAIKMMVSHLRPTAGQVRLFGYDVEHDYLSVAKRVGSLVETPVFYPNLTAEENLVICGQLFKTSLTRINVVLEMVGLRQHASKPVKRFSLGMKQRLGIAQALMHDPDLLILDEPTNGLDPSGIHEIRRLLARLSKDEGKTILISSHILGEVQQLADMVGIINNGKLVGEYTIEEIKGSGQEYLLLETDENQLSIRVINGLKLPCELTEDGRKIRVFCKKEQNKRINRELVNSGVGLISSQSKGADLEEHFMRITGRDAA